MKKKFSLFEELNKNQRAIESIDQCVKITLGPTGKNGILSTEKQPIKFLTSGSLLMKSLEFPTASENILLKLIILNLFLINLIFLYRNHQYIYLKLNLH